MPRTKLWYADSRGQETFVAASYPRSQDERTEIADGGCSRQEPPRSRRDFAIGPATADLEEMVSGGLMGRPANGRGRWHADSWNETFWTFHPRQAKPVVMAVHDELGAGAADQSREVARVHEAAPELRGCGLRRMVQHHDPGEPARAGFDEKPLGGL